jgi:hypothetical protein
MTNPDGITIAANDLENAASRVRERGRFPSSVAAALAGHPGLLVQLAAFVLACVAASECHSVVTRTAPEAPLLPSMIYGLVLWYWWGIAATVIWKLAERSGREFFAMASAARHVLLAMVFAGLHPLILQQTVKELIAKWPVLGAAGYGSLDYLNWNRFSFELLVFGFILGLTGVIRLQVSSQREAIRMLSLEKELSLAHLKALQMQIEPHFLFNTLNAITSLVESDRREEALHTLQRLNCILKATLRRGLPEKVALAEELELVDNYLSIEELRFADRMRVELTIDPATLDGRIPCFLLQPMIENAIRHGIAQSEEGGVIQVEAKRLENRLHLAIKNSGRDTRVKGQAGHGIGLENTRERLAHFYNKNHQFRAFAPESGGFEVLIDIPYERNVG